MPFPFLFQGFDSLEVRDLQTRCNIVVVRSVDQILPYCVIKTKVTPPSRPQGGPFPMPSGPLGNRPLTDGSMPNQHKPVPPPLPLTKPNGPNETKVMRPSRPKVGPYPMPNGPLETRPLTDGPISNRHVPVLPKPNRHVPVPPKPNRHVPVPLMPNRHVPVPPKPNRHVPVPLMPNRHVPIPSKPNGPMPNRRGSFPAPPPHSTSEMPNGTMPNQNQTVTPPSQCQSNRHRLASPQKSANISGPQLNPVVSDPFRSLHNHNRSTCPVCQVSRSLF
jgi:hypothetical protein